jgi:hypothetical protein
MTPLCDILPRMFEVDFERRPGDLGARSIVMAVAPQAALETACGLFPEHLRAGQQPFVREIDHVEIDWETGRAFVIQRERRALIVGDCCQNEIKARRRDGRRVDDMTRIWERLFLGGLSAAEVLAELNEFDIATVVNLGTEEVCARAQGANYLGFPIVSARPISASQFDAIMDAMWENVRWGRVLVHSHAGTGRAPIIVAAWMQAVGCCGIDIGMAKVAKLCPVEPDPILLQSVKEVLR